MGTKEGAAKAVKTIYKNHGRDFFKVQGKKGGAASSLGGFASEKVGKDGLTGRERASRYGSIGGRVSRRKKA